ncbi:hypothetical protein J7F03_26110 [Streptomyces sp. ISL-43]|uniref:hypothetical protein n=1 Tax=Streptomyces sp. ISL-43 TaxID=2819183 RepID=UPI001BE5665A|nr:hypothetical protein [Streptomyces sp. ISL-43]MBT2450488.1 hypothetical protein [Streptomyces sp. ISL-43]
MAAVDFSPVMSAVAHPMANPGFGKREAPGQLARTADDFGHLSKRDAALAVFIDRLPEGAAMDHKTLAAHLSGMGQAGARGALDHLTAAGHLRRLKERVVREGSSRWVTRTYFSRTARDDAWWRAYCRSVGARLVPVPGVAPVEPSAGGEAAEAVDPAAVAGAAQVLPVERTTAYRVLAKLKDTDPAAVLSAAECASLAPLATAWLESGVDVCQLTYALTNGLPKPLRHPAALIRKRLEEKMPPKRSIEPEPETVEQAMLMCMYCDDTEQTVEIVNGVCPDCVVDDSEIDYTEFDAWLETLNFAEAPEAPPATPQSAPRPAPGPEEVQVLADTLREAAGLPPKRRG